MTKCYMYSCLLCALSVVEMKTLTVHGRVGEDVLFKCSDWNTVINVKEKTKYFCYDPCTEDQHVIVKAKYKETKSNNSIELTNSGEGLFVTFSNLQKSDSKKYYCGVEGFFYDSYVAVNLRVTDAKSPPRPTISVSTRTVAVTNSTLSPVSSDITTATSASSTIHPTTTSSPTSQGPGGLPYLILGVTVMIMSLIILLMCLRRMTKKQSNEGDAREVIEYDEIRPEEKHTESQLAGISTIYNTEDPDSLYANCHNHSSDSHPRRSSSTLAYSSVVFTRNACAESRVTDPPGDVVYSVAQQPRTHTVQPEQSGANQSNENESFYSLAKLPDSG